MRLRLGTWVGGKPENSEGTVDWSGGLADFTRAPFVAVHQDVKVVDYGGAPGGEPAATDNGENRNNTVTESAAAYLVRSGNAAPGHGRGAPEVVVVTAGRESAVSAAKTPQATQQEHQAADSMATPASPGAEVTALEGTGTVRNLSLAVPPFTSYVSHGGRQGSATASSSQTAVGGQPADTPTMVPGPSLADERDGRSGAAMV